MTEPAPDEPPGRAKPVAALDAEAPDTLQMAPGTTRLKPLTHWQVLVVAGPIMVSNATTPLVGYADTAV
ncbi:MAG: hypothetical protein AAFR55_03150, partial [Pseudomonadota bacterium]